MNEKLQYIGKSASVMTHWGFSVNVIIKDYKNSYGRDRWFVEPLSGTGGAWVENVVHES